MKIDRSRFLVLTAAIGASAISATACVVTSSNDPGTNDGGTVDSGSTADASGNVDGSKADSGTTSDAAADATSDATTTTDAGKDGATTDGSSTTDGSTTADSGSDGSTTTDSGSDASDGAAACNNDLAPGDGGSFVCPTGEDTVGCLSAFQCEDLKTRLRNAPLDGMLNCLATADANACFGSTGENARCLGVVVTATCADDTTAVASTCTMARAACGADASMPLEGCEDYAVMLTATERTQFISCITENGCGPTAINDCAVLFVGG
ncbi:MAG: hypothetical protein U0169_18205 [Polyangiaceae bacterium]